MPRHARDGLTSWNAGENFASLGIGHLRVWPRKRGQRAISEESFPKLVRFYQARGQKLPDWLQPELDCPWSTRAEFEYDLQSVRMKELRELLASTIRLQSHFSSPSEGEAALPKMLAEAAPRRTQSDSRAISNGLAATGPGTFALIDYAELSRVKEAIRLSVKKGRRLGDCRCWPT